MKKNDQLSSHHVIDLNKKNGLSRLEKASKSVPPAWEDHRFDVITNVVSIDYLKRPLELTKTAYDLLKPGGAVIYSWSNRMFWTKAVRLWTEASEWQRVLVAASFMRLAGFEEVAAWEVSEDERGDPLYVLRGRKPLESDGDKKKEEL